MTSEPVRLLQFNDIRDRALARIRQRFDLVQMRGGEALPADADRAGVRGIATGFPPTKIDAGVIDAFPALEIICSFGVGYDLIDVDHATRRGIVVTNTPGVVDEDVADLAIGLTLATIREIPYAYEYAMDGRWERAPFHLTPSLRQRRVGLLGYGQIGQAIARRLGGFGVDIAYHARRPRAGAPHAYHDTPEALARAVDLMIVIVPGGAGTRHLVDESVLSALGAGGILINMARGTVVDQEALIRALDTGKILAAGLDVLDGEPAVPDALKHRRNVVVLPHVGGATHFTRDAISDLMADNLEAWFDGRGALTPVNAVATAGEPARK